jgi:hypothetical protein
LEGALRAQQALGAQLEAARSTQSHLSSELAMLTRTQAAELAAQQQHAWDHAAGLERDCLAAQAQVGARAYLCMCMWQAGGYLAVNLSIYAYLFFGEDVVCNVCFCDLIDKLKWAIGGLEDTRKLCSGRLLDALCPFFALWVIGDGYLCLFYAFDCFGLMLSLCWFFYLSNEGFFYITHTC